MQSRNDRQDIGLDKWVDAGATGTLEWATSVGKTFAAMKAIKRCRRNEPKRSVMIVVPTLPLKKQWEERLRQSGIGNVSVFVINTFITLDHPSPCLLIIDEIHRCGAKEFSRIFQITRWDFLLGLTATMERLDGKHAIIQRHAPIVDRISLAEARKNGWVAEYEMYNLGVEFNISDRIAYKEIEKRRRTYMNKFFNNFDLMKNCSFGSKLILNKATGQWFEPTAVKFARSMGWRGNSLEQAVQQHMKNQSLKPKDRVNIWGKKDMSPESIWHPDNVFLMGLQGMRATQERRAYLHKAQCKIEAALTLINRVGKKTITFSESTEFADELATLLGKKAVVYHSNLATIKVKKRRLVRRRKTMPDLYKTVTVKKGKQTLKREALQAIATGKAQVICTAKALDEGFSVDDIELVVICSMTSNPLQYIQRSGRGLRKIVLNGKEKQALIVNIYIKDTQDEKWLQKAQAKSPGIRWIDSIEEIFEERFEII